MWFWAWRRRRRGDANSVVGSKEMVARASNICLSISSTLACRVSGARPFLGRRPLKTAAHCRSRSLSLKLLQAAASAWQPSFLLRHHGGGGFVGLSDLLSPCSAVYHSSSKSSATRPLEAASERLRPRSEALRLPVAFPQRQCHNLIPQRRCYFKSESGLRRPRLGDKVM